MTTQITDELIVQHLLQKEAGLVSQLQKVRAALGAYGIFDNSEEEIRHIVGDVAYNEVFGANDYSDYDLYLSYDQKVLYALRHINTGYIDNMRDFLIKIGDDTDEKKLYNGLTGGASRLYTKGILKADTRGRKYKYSLNSDKEKEAVEILPLQK